MATLLLTAVGTAIGGPLGGALGALVGRQVDSAIFGTGGREGPRLNELTVQTSSYGSAIPLHFGKVRAAGSVIWSTDLVEHREKKGGGKGRPSVTTYTYTASFAVALSSRPIAGIGRIWADGNLLRGAEGDLKVGGKFRFHTGHGDQTADSIISQAEGAQRCPAFRHIAYAVFEDLELADYGNRLPSLTLEVIAEDGGTSLSAIVGELAPEAVAEDLGQPLLGFTIDRGTASDTLAVLSDAFPVIATAWGDSLRIADAETPPASAPPVLPQPVAGSSDTDAGHQTGTTTQRAPQPRSRTCGLRYYDVDRDYQPGLQRGRGRAEPSEMAVIELPAALTAADARTIADAASRRSVRPSETTRYRIAELDQRYRPGALARIPGQSGVWRVRQWEWQADGINLDLLRVPPRPAESASGADSGRINTPLDAAAPATTLMAVELPWDGAGEGNRPAVFAAASAASPGWTGAALFAARGGGVITPLGSTGRKRATIGSALTVLPPANPLLFDAASNLDVELSAPDLALQDADYPQLCEGANRAVVGAEIIQFGSAVALGSGRWRLSQLLRGRGGTEWACGTHVAGDHFIMIDDSLLPLDPQDLGDPATTRILASGLGDTAPVSASIDGAGSTLRPLSPIRGAAWLETDGTLHLNWTRRARGAWIWADQVDVPLHEQSEAWEVAHVAGSTRSTWQATSAVLALSSAQVAALPSEGRFEVRQVGSFARSIPLVIPFPA